MLKTSYSLLILIKNIDGKKYQTISINFTEIADLLIKYYCKLQDKTSIYWKNDQKLLDCIIKFIY